ncbi:MAG TPA: hypothetical protein PLZ52_06365 [Bacteroidales bacterium]|nr:hypothetical protein [Bacteroidales bacterium]
MNNMKNLQQKTEEILATVKRMEMNGLHRIESDMLLQQIRELYSMVLGMDTTAAAEIKPIQKQEAVTPVAAEKHPIKTSSDFIEFDNSEPTVFVPMVESKPEKTEPVPVINEPIAVVKPPVAEPKPIETPATKKTAAQTGQHSLFNGISETETKTLGEQLGENKTSLNDLLALKGSQQDVATRITAKPITDIRSAIGVGDRFLFIRELFDGDNDNFNKTIDYLNSLQQSHEAQSYLNSNFKWNSDSNTVKHFMSIIQRKYIK